MSSGLPLLCAIATVFLVRSPEPHPALHAIEAIVTAGFAGVACALALRWRPRQSRGKTAALGATLGALFFLILGGVRVMLPTETGWVMRVDWQWHHLGWMFFRAGGWSWPPGQTPLLFSPSGSSIALTDSVPAAAFLLKGVAPLLPDEVQYLGAWLLLSFSLQGMCGALIVQRAASTGWQVAASAWLLVTAPVLLNRIGHVGLASHWLVLLAIGLAFGLVRPGRPGLWLPLTAFFSGMVHPYLAVMATALLVAAVAAGPGSGLERMRLSFTLITALGLALWAAGLFAVPVEALGGEGLGLYGANLNAWINPAGWSRLLPDLPVALAGQRFESLAFLGAGTLALLLGLAVLLAKAHWTERALPGLSRVARRHWPALLVLVGLCLVGFGPDYSVGGSTIGALPDPLRGPLEAVRVTGRLVWPATYALTIGVLVGWMRRAPPNVSSLVLLLAAALQTVDVAPTMQTRFRAVRSTPDFFAWAERPRLVEWSFLKEYRRVTVLLDAPCGGDSSALAPLLWITARYGLAVNVGHASRMDRAAVRATCAEALAQVRQGTLDPSTVVIASEGLQRELSDADTGFRCALHDGYNVCLPSAHAQSARR